MLETCLVSVQAMPVGVKAIDKCKRRRHVSQYTTFFNAADTALAPKVHWNLEVPARRRRVATHTATPLQRRHTAAPRSHLAGGVPRSSSWTMEEDYGLEAGSGTDDENEEADLANDDTFGDLPAMVAGEGDFDFNHEQMARLHEEFLGESGAGFFGGGIQDGSTDFMLEAERGELEPREPEPEIDLDAYTQFLDEPGPHSPSAPSETGIRNGIRVAGLPANLDEVQVKQLLSHFGQLATFTLHRSAQSGTALLSYQDPAVAKAACASLHGIPLGGRWVRPLGTPARKPSLLASG